MSPRFTSLPAAALIAALAGSCYSTAWAKSKSELASDCAGLPGQAALMAGLRLAHQASPLPGANANGVTWIAVVNKQGQVCAAASNDRDADAAGVAPAFDKGLPLYNAKGNFMGAISVAGAGSACSNHVLAWRARAAYYLDYVPSTYAGAKIGPVSWTSNLNPSPCATSTAGMTALSELPATRRNPASADQSQALHGQ